MAIITFARSFLPLSSRLRFHLPLAPAFCVLTSSFSNLRRASTLQLGCSQSHPLLPLIWSKFTRKSTESGIHSAAMDSSTGDVVPCIVVYVTVPNREAGTRLAESIVKEKLAACVNIVPGIQSIYHWDGQVQSDAEELLIVKTRESLLEALTDHVKTTHEYQVPEVISTRITGGNLKYLEWIKNNTRDE